MKRDITIDAEARVGRGKNEARRLRVPGAPQDPSEDLRGALKFLPGGALSPPQYADLQDAIRIGEPGEYEVPADHVPRLMVGESVPDRPREVATVRARAGAAQSLRRRASSVTPDGEGWDVLTVEFGDAEMLAEELVGLGAAVVASAPPSLRESVVRRLSAAGPLM